jgi:hypothetical protein
VICERQRILMVWVVEIDEGLLGNRLELELTVLLGERVLRRCRKVARRCS